MIPMNVFALCIQCTVTQHIVLSGAERDEQGGDTECADI